MAVNKVIYGETTLLDLTSDTVTAANLCNGVTAHDKAGEKITGTNPYNASNIEPVASESLSALSDKGVELTGSEGIFDIPSLIAKIETGGDVSPFSEIFTGLYTPTANTREFPLQELAGIETGDSVKVLVVGEVSANGKTNTGTTNAAYINYSKQLSFLRYGTSTGSYTNYPSLDFRGIINFPTNYSLLAGITYFYIIAV